MSEIKSTAGLKKLYQNMSDDIRDYFELLEPIISHDDLPLDVALAYMFLKMEEGQNRALYGGLTKIHKCEKSIAATAVQGKHITREGFKVLYENVLGKPIDMQTSKKIEHAQKIRDKVVHGKGATDAEKRTAIAEVLHYANSVNEQTENLAQFRPFGSMRGFRGANQEELGIKTTKWVVKGMGFDNIRS